MKLTAEQVNMLKIMTEGYDDSGCGDNPYTKIYNRLKWNTPKVIRLSFLEKDYLSYKLESQYIDEQERLLIESLIK